MSIVILYKLGQNASRLRHVTFDRAHIIFHMGKYKHENDTS